MNRLESHKDLLQAKYNTPEKEKLKNSEKPSQLFRRKKKREKKNKIKKTENLNLLGHGIIPDHPPLVKSPNCLTLHPPTG
jgi:hypothetical protein